MKVKLYNLSHDFSAPAAEDKPIFIPFGSWPYDAKVSQSFDRAHAEKIAAALANEIAVGNPGIPVYQGHPDVPSLAAKYPDKGALGWVRRIAVANEGCYLTVEWDRFPGKGFGWFSPYWFGEPAGLDNEGKTNVVVDHIASIGLVNNPNISEFRLPNEAEDNNNTNKENTMNREELITMLGLPPEATDDQIKAAVADLKKAGEAKAAAEQKADEAEKAVAAANAECCGAKAACDDAKKELDNCRKQLDETKAALANEKAEHDKLKALKTASVTTGLANAKPATDTRMGLVNEIMRTEQISFDLAWAKAKTQKPDLFK